MGPVSPQAAVFAVDDDEWPELETPSEVSDQRDGLPEQESRWVIG